MKSVKGTVEPARPRLHVRIRLSSSAGEEGLRAASRNLSHCPASRSGTLCPWGQGLSPPFPGPGPGLHWCTNHPHHPSAAQAAENDLATHGQAGAQQTNSRRAQLCLREPSRLACPYLHHLSIQHAGHWKVPGKVTV